MAGATWPPDPGETVGIELASRTLLDFDAEIRRVGRETVAEILATEPDVTIDRRIVPASALARETREPEPYRGGVVVAVVSWLSRSGSTQVVGIGLGWDGMVRRSRLPWE